MIIKDLWICSVLLSITLNSTKEIDQGNLCGVIYCGLDVFIEFNTESTWKLSHMGNNEGIHGHRHELFMLGDGYFKELYTYTLDLTNYCII